MLLPMLRVLLATSLRRPPAGDASLGQAGTRRTLLVAMENEKRLGPPVKLLCPARPRLVGRTYPSRRALVAGLPRRRNRACAQFG